jgi:hypothetical protein
MKGIMDAGLKYLSSPRKALQDGYTSENDFPDDDTFQNPAPVDNMSILHSAMQQHASTLEPSMSISRPSDASRYKLFCAEAGIVGTTADFFLWQEKQTSGQKPSPLSPVVLSDTPANNTGKITIGRLTAAGVLCTHFITDKLASGFNKSVFAASALYEVYIHVRHSAGMGIISTDTIWAFVTVNGITSSMCDELVLAQYNELVLDYPDPERPVLSLLRVFEVTMGIIMVRSLRSMMQNIKEADDTRGYGAPFRLKCFLYVIHRLVQDALHNPRYTQIVHPFNDLVEDEIVNSTLISEYFATAKVSRQRIKDAKHALDIQNVNARLDKIARTSVPIGTGRTVTKDSSIPATKDKKTQVCLLHARSPLLCSEPCPNGRLHSWPDTMPPEVKEHLLSRAAKIPLPASQKPLKPAGTSVAGSIKSQKTGHKPRHSSPSSMESAVSSISEPEETV